MLLSKDFIKLVLIAIVLASPIAYYLMEYWLNGFAYRMDLHWGFLFSAGLVSLAVTFGVVVLQSSKAAIMNPVRALRSE